MRSASPPSMTSSMVVAIVVSQSESLTEESATVGLCADPILSVASTVPILEYFQIGLNAIASDTSLVGSMESMAIV
jgi:hypothetical protein